MTESRTNKVYDFAPNISTENYKNTANYTPYHGTNFGDHYDCPARCQNSLDMQRNYFCSETKFVNKKSVINESSECRRIIALLSEKEDEDF